MSTIQPRLHLKSNVSCPLTPLDVESRDERVEGQGYDVCFEGEVIGTISATIAWRNRTLRWHDVTQIKENRKRKREPELPGHERSLMLLDKCLENSSKQSKPQYFENPFPYGCDSIQELAMVGGEEFKRSMQLYNHWFNVPPLERLDREMRNFDHAKLSTDELKDAEKKLKALWCEVHGALMKRVSGR